MDFFDELQGHLTVTMHSHTLTVHSTMMDFTHERQSKAGHMTKRPALWLATTCFHSCEWQVGAKLGGAT